MSLARFTYLLLFSPGIILGIITVVRLWKAFGSLSNPWFYRRRFLRIFFYVMFIAWGMDYLLIYFEAWTFPASTHLFNLPVWPALTYYKHPMVIPFEEFFIFNTLIAWFVLYLVFFQITVSFDTNLSLLYKGADKRTSFTLSVENKHITKVSEPFWLVALFRKIKKGGH